MYFLAPKVHPPGTKNFWLKGLGSKLVYPSAADDQQCILSGISKNQDFWAIEADFFDLCSKNAYRTKKA
jgi:hypothetical protein